MKFLFAIPFIFISMLSLAQSAQNEIAIIPQPVSLVKKAGAFTLTTVTTLVAPEENTLNVPLQLFKKQIETTTGKRLNIIKNNKNKAAITLALNNTTQTKIGAEGYTLSVAPGNILIKANTTKGLANGLQTLRQLLPAQIEGTKISKDVVWKIPALEITDYPRVGWRGLMLDVARHFFTKDEVKRFIDDMVKYKYNLLHWHLTDDEGWRIEIKSLPKLTEVGAWRTYKVGDFGTFTPPAADAKKDYGGYYTQDDIREIVKYAKDRFVDIMPEIDVPGHSLAAIAAYPDLSCTEGAEKYKVRSGEPIMDWSHGAPPIALIDNTLCPANEKVYTFLDKVMTEVAELFPFEYIHVGGDEAPHNFWEKSEQVKTLMKKENLKTIPQVQAYFENRLEKIVNAKGKKMMGWDEILEGGISPTAALMSWRGEKYGIEASQTKHKVVMTPTKYCYIDYMQGDAATEPPVYASLRLHTTYQFNPIPAGANADYIMGGQGNLWTEQVYNLRQAQYMTWPRGFALAEAMWSPEAKKDWKSFVTRTEAHFKRLDAAQTKYSPAMYDPAIKMSKKENAYFVELVPEIDGLDLYYSFDNSTPDQFYPKYKSAIKIPEDAQLMRIISYKDDKAAGRLMTITVADLKHRVK